MFSFRNEDLPLNKEVRNSLQVIWGVGWRKSIIIAARVGLAYPHFMKNLSFYLFCLMVYLLKHLVVSYSRCSRVISLNIKTLVEIKCWKGFRHSLSLPVHGQRSKTNARTSKRRIKLW
jgi:small subunit ribosomal protein S13